MFRCAIFVLALLLVQFAYASERVEKMVKPFVRVNNASGVVIRAWQHGEDYWCYVLTAHHVVKHLDALRVPSEFPRFDGDGHEWGSQRILGRVSFANEDLDYAILTYKTNIIGLVQAANAVTAAEEYETLDVFDMVYAVGAPNGQRMWATHGVVSSLNPIKNPGYLGHDAKIYFGSSGGPLYDEDYRLIGINLKVGADKKTKQVLEYHGYARRLSTIYYDLGEQKTSVYFGLPRR